MERTQPADLDTQQEGAEAPAESVRARRGTGRRLHGAIANKLGRAILSGDYAPGDRLDGEVAFSESLDVSRTAYREAIQVLVAKGLVESKPKAGTRVLPRSRWNLLDPEVLAWAFSGQPQLEFVRDLFELRSIIEPAAARFAAERRNRGDLKTMRDALAGMRQHTLATDAGRAADRDFHDAILTATRNDALIVLSASIGAAVSWTTVFKQRGAPLPRNAIPDHVRVYDAIAAGNGEAAAEAMRALGRALVALALALEALLADYVDLARIIRPLLEAWYAVPPSHRGVGTQITGGRQAQRCLPVAHVDPPASAS